MLVLDEPTAALSKGEAARLFAALRLLAGEGIGIIFVSHRLDEIFDISNRITVLRDGKHVATRNISEISQDQVVRLMVNRDVVFESQSTFENKGEVLLEVRDFSGERFDKVNLAVHEGEVVGLAGVVGAGEPSCWRRLSASGERIRARSC